MAIYFPANQQFESFLSNCAVVREKPTQRFVPLSKSGDNIGGMQQAPVLYFTYPDSDLQFESVLKKVSNALENSGCPQSRGVAVATLALIVETRQSTTPAVEHANDCMSLTHPARLMQSLIFPGRPRSNYEIRFGNYAIRPFNPEKLLYWAKRGKSAYPIDLRELGGWAALEREPLDMHLIDWTSDDLAGPLLAKWGHRLASDCLLDQYYSEIAFALAQQIKTRLKSEALVLESAAMVWLGIESLLNTLFLKIISYFVMSNASGTTGWATYSEQSGLHVNFSSPEDVAACRDWMVKELGFTDLSETSPLDKGVQTYCRFLQRAHGHRLEGRHDESFLHFAIALDLLLGSEGRSQDSVAQRAALLTHRQLDLTLDKQTQEIKHLYAVRSKYVHEGQSVAPKDLGAVEHACTEILWALLSISSKKTFCDLDEWIRKIDFLHAAVRANMAFSELDFQSIGVPPLGHARQPPLRVLEDAHDQDDEGKPRRLF
jgi:hypothetical protein